MSLSAQSAKAMERRGAGRLYAIAAALGVALTVLFAQAVPAMANGGKNGDNGPQALSSALNGKADLINEGTTVQLNGNVELTSLFWVNRDTVLDLNGHTLTIGVQPFFVGHVSENPTLTITDSSEGSNGKVVRKADVADSGSAWSLIQVGNDLKEAQGNLVVEKGTIDARNAFALKIFKGGATLEDGKILGGGRVGGKGRYMAVLVVDSSTFTIKGGEVGVSELTAESNKPLYGGGIFPLGTSPIVNVDGGVVRGATPISTNGHATTGTYKAKINVSGGLLECTDVQDERDDGPVFSCAVYLPSAPSQPENVNTLTVTGGHIKGGIGVLNIGSKVVVEAGDDTTPVIEAIETDYVQSGDARYSDHDKTYVTYPPAAVVVAHVTGYAQTGDVVISAGKFLAQTGPAVTSVTVDTSKDSNETGQKVSNDRLTVSGGTFTAPVNPSHLKDVKAFVSISSDDASTISYFTEVEAAETFAAAQNEANPGSAHVVPISVADGVTVIMGFAAKAEDAVKGIAEAAEAVGWDPARIPGKDSVKNTMWVVYKTSPNATTTVNFTEDGHQVYPATGPFDHSTREPGYGAVWFTFGPGNSSDAALSNDYMTPKVGTYKVKVTNTDDSKFAEAELALSSATFDPTDGTWAPDNPVAPYVLKDGNAVAFFAAGQAISDPGTVVAEGHVFMGWNPLPATAPADPTALEFEAQWEEEPAPGMVAVHRLYNRFAGTHLYTMDLNEVRELVKLGWTDEGVFWQAPERGKGAYTVVRLYNPFSGDHYYLKESDEPQLEVLLELGWKKDGESTWFDSAEPDEGIAVSTLFNPFTGVDTHLYTPDVNEVTELLVLGWQEHGTVIWAAALPA